jgi:hypothetical protein
MKKIAHLLTLLRRGIGIITINERSSISPCPIAPSFDKLRMTDVMVNLANHSSLWQREGRRDLTIQYPHTYDLIHKDTFYKIENYVL